MSSENTVTLFYGVRFDSIEEEKAKKDIDAGSYFLFRNYKTVNNNNRCYQFIEYEPEFWKWYEWRNAQVFIGEELAEISLSAPVKDFVPTGKIDVHQIDEMVKAAGLDTNSLGYHFISTIYWE